MNIKALVEKWRSKVEHSDHVFTWTELESLCYIAEVASKTKLMVEVGTYMGRSAKVALDAGCEHLWCVDLFMVAGTQKVTEYFLRDYIREGRCEIIVGDSARGAAMLQHTRGKLDAVWVDDGHATEDVKRDIRSFLPLLRSGGELFGHDFDVPHNDVALGVIQSLPSWQIPVPRVWSYIKP